MKRILILSSHYTGHGHKSIAEALCEAFGKIGETRVDVVDGFALGGPALHKIGKSYGLVTRNSQELWKLLWRLSSAMPRLINDIVEHAIKEQFAQAVNRMKPDLIVSVHPMFNGSVLNILEKQGLRIPFVTLIADLVSISPLWADPRADYIISPTEEAKLPCMKFGVPESKIRVLGFPVRSRFCFLPRREVRPDRIPGSKDHPLQCLIMSGGEGVGNMRQTAAALLDHFPCRVNIVAGRNPIVRQELERSLKGMYGEKVNIYGFVEEIQDLMMSSDLIFARGSPNVMMEAVACNVPLVITGALPGQEEGNPEYVRNHRLGELCGNPRHIPETVRGLLANQARKLHQIRASQKRLMDPDIAGRIAAFLLTVEPQANLLSVQASRRAGRAGKGA